MILSLLYPNLKYGQVKFHQDHIHPASFFTNSNLSSLGLSKEEIKQWQYMKDRLPNLQMLEGVENVSKNNTSFKEWINLKDINGNLLIGDKDLYKKNNYIDITVDEDIKGFKEFYNKRKEILRDEIRKRIWASNYIKKYLVELEK